MAGEKIFEEKVKRYLESKGIYRLGTPKNKMSVTPVGYYEKRFANAYTGAGLPDRRSAFPARRQRTAGTASGL